MGEYTASIIGGSGYAGGELLRILHGHPDFEILQVTSREYDNRSVRAVHPNLPEIGLRFTGSDELEQVDVLFSATPPGVAMENIDRYSDVAEKVVDLGPDFRLNDLELYRHWYGEHERPEMLERFEYALPEVNRENLANADMIAAGGCNATASILGLYPLRNFLGEERIIVDAKVGSSEGGTGGGRTSSHAERTGIIRPYAPTEHRHAAELQQVAGLEADFTAHAVEMVRGAYATIHVVTEGAENQEVWSLFREEYNEEPFIRFTSGSGIHRYPQPKNVAGTNYGELGFEAGDDRVVVFSAIDNLVKGSAGQAVQAVNISLGLEETKGLENEGLHPVGTP